MEEIEYKGVKFKVYTGIKGGKYILINNKKKYLPKTAKIEVKPKMLSREVPDPEHEGDIEYELKQLSKIGDYKVSYIEREYTEDGEELTYACIHFYCNDKDYKAFQGYCGDDYR